MAQASVKLDSTVHRLNHYPAGEEFGKQMGQLLSLRIAHALLSFNTAGRFIEDHGLNPFPYLRNGPFLLLQCNSTKFQVSVVFSSSPQAGLR